MQRSAPTNLTVRLARNSHEIMMAQALRYRVFFEAMGAAPTPQVKALKRDVDAFDEYCDHLLVLENEGAEDPAQTMVVGTYRLLRRSVAKRRSGYYSASEFDLGRLKNYSGEHVELGRSCVDSDYRGKAIMQLLWRGIADYLMTYDISLMFGCASFPGTEIGEFASALTYLQRFHKAPSFWRPVAQTGRHVPMKILKKDQLDVKWMEESKFFSPVMNSKELLYQQTRIPVIDQLTVGNSL